MCCYPSESGRLNQIWLCSLLALGKSHNLSGTRWVCNEKQLINAATNGHQVLGCELQEDRAKSVLFAFAFWGLTEHTAGGRCLVCICWMNSCEWEPGLGDFGPFHCISMASFLFLGWGWLVCFQSRVAGSKWLPKAIPNPLSPYWGWT